MAKLASRKSNTLTIVFASLCLLQLATCPPQWNQSTATIRLTATGKFFYKIVHSRTKLTALTTDDNIVLSPVTGRIDLKPSNLLRKCRSHSTCSNNISQNQRRFGEKHRLLGTYRSVCSLWRGWLLHLRVQRLWSI